MFRKGNLEKPVPVEISPKAVLRFSPGVQRRDSALAAFRGHKHPASGWRRNLPGWALCWVIQAVLHWFLLPNPHPYLRGKHEGGAGDRRGWAVSHAATTILACAAGCRLPYGSCHNLEQPPELAELCQRLLKLLEWSRIQKTQRWAKATFASSSSWAFLPGNSAQNRTLGAYPDLF